MGVRALLQDAHMVPHGVGDEAWGAKAVSVEGDQSWEHRITLRRLPEGRKAEGPSSPMSGIPSTGGWEPQRRGAWFTS